MVGKDYPRPMIDHEKAQSLNMEKMKAVYQQVLTRTSECKLCQTYKIDVDVLTHKAILSELSKANQQRAIHDFISLQPHSSKKISADSVMPSFSE